MTFETFPREVTSTAADVPKPVVKHATKEGFFTGAEKLNNIDKLKATLREARETNDRLKKIAEGFEGLLTEYRTVIDRVQKVADDMEGHDGTSA